MPAADLPLVSEPAIGREGERPPPCHAGQVITLRELLIDLPGDDVEGKTIYAARPWTADSRAVILPDESAPAGLDYLLEVDLAGEAIDVWQEWHGRPATPDDRCRAVIHCATHDAYLEE